MSFQTYYGFTRLPFAKDIPPADLFPAEGQQELCARLAYLTQQRGMGLVTGETGCGKSTALRRFTATLDTNRFFVLYLSNPLLGLTGLYRELLSALGHEPPFSRPKMVARIRFVFEDLLTSKHRTPFLILDEAHLLPDTAFEQLRLLFSAQMDSQSLGALLLVGQPELRRTLRLASHEAFFQRLTTTYHLPPLDLPQSMAYIRHQITFSGYKGGGLFADDALARIYDFTKGIPRQINRLCTTALLVGMADGKQILEESAIRKAIAELDQT
jgi:type II secretory pathway predicted ATPase ExeA